MALAGETRRHLLANHTREPYQGFKLLDDQQLYASSVVANCCMNRERGISGANSYAQELKVDIVEWLRHLDDGGPRRWLDVCCGTGRALVEAASALGIDSGSRQISIEGIDLVGHFVSHEFSPRLSLKVVPIEDWEPIVEYDLVTCVHGLHYVGDKLHALTKLANCLSERGLFIANVDLSNFRFNDGSSAARTVAKRFRENGFSYQSRTRLLECRGKHQIESFGLTYTGADDKAGPNYTGQSAIDSYYSK